MSWKDRTVFITGASRGIGLAIALRLAREGANIVIAAKTTEPHPKLEGTIYTAAEEIERVGGRALPVKTDIRFEDQIRSAVDQAVQHFGGIDGLVNNASAIRLTPLEHTPVKDLDLMHQINIRGTLLCGQACLPHLKKSDRAHILTLSPPIDLDPKWFEGYGIYTISKYGMTMAAMTMAQEFRDYGIHSNCLWPRTTIATAAVRNLLGGEDMIRASRTPEIVGNAAFAILSDHSAKNNGHTYIDEAVLSAAGEEDFDRYAVDQGSPLMPDLFIPND